MNKRSQRWTVVPGLIGCRWVRKGGGGWRTIYKQKMEDRHLDFGKSRLSIKGDA